LLRNKLVFPRSGRLCIANKAIKLAEAISAAPSPYRLSKMLAAEQHHGVNYSFFKVRIAASYGNDVAYSFIDRRLFLELRHIIFPSGPD
jgi:hypothetical protein